MMTTILEKSLSRAYISAEHTHMSRKYSCTVQNNHVLHMETFATGTDAKITTRDKLLSTEHRMVLFTPHTQALSFSP